MKKFLSVHKQQIVWGVAALFAAAALVVWGEIFATAAKPDLAVYFFDVGQGDAALIAARDGTQILVDGGPDGTVMARLASVLPYYDRSLDAVIITHPHADHITGLIEVLKRFEADTIFESGAAYHTAEAGELEKIIMEKESTRVVVDHQITTRFFNGATLRFVTPQKSFADAVLKNVHDAMLVFELEYGGTKILFMGDAEKNTEDVLVWQHAVGDIDILKVGHHGSKTSSQSYFLNKTKPEYAVVSTGKNKYGHPTQEVLSRLAAVGAKTFRTDIVGTVVAEFRAGGFVVKTENE